MSGFTLISILALATMLVVDFITSISDRTNIRMFTSFFKLMLFIQVIEVLM